MNSKKKGNGGENRFAHFLKEHGFGAARNGSSGANMWKGDIHSFDLPMCFEVKTVKALNVREAWRQVMRDAGMSHQVPVLAVHYDGMQDGSWLITMESGDWVEYMKEASQKERTRITSATRGDLAAQLREIADDLDAG